MTPERHQQIGQLYHAVLELAPAERAAFLAQACAGDDALRREVESLLALQAEAGDFFAAPAMEVAARTLAAEQAQVARVEQLGHYRIIAPLGAGGMGEVYLAQDLKLGRKLALKLLPAAFLAAPDRLRRFEQEARAASALNHPNIITIYEVGEVEGTHYIATEYVDGQTLRQRLVGEPLSLLNALEIVQQIAAALAAAHEAGIIHRDIKPENVMLRRDGLVKVLDFGLAKLTERAALDAEAPSAVKVETDSQTVLGTASYMSPEQARGQVVDARTDIFSLGIVLYEMIAGRAPFEGVSSVDVLAAILQLEPLPLRQHVPSAPAELQRIVSKTLRKERDERYQTIKDLLLDLRSLKQELELETRAGRGNTGGGEPAATTATTRAARTGGGEVTRQTSSAEYLFGQVKGHPRATLILLAALLLAGAGVAFGLYKLGARRNATLPAQTLQMTKLNVDDSVQDVAISPDGKFLAYTTSGFGGRQSSLRVRQLSTSSDVQLAPASSDVVYSQLKFSRDGDFVYYLVWERYLPGSALYQIPILGGPAKKLISNVSSFALSSDGKRVAFVRGKSLDKESLLLVAEADGSHERELARRSRPDLLGNLAWSPDDRIIICVVRRPEGFLGSRADTQLIEVRADGGGERPLSERRWVGVGSMEWLPDSSGLLINAREQHGEGVQLWRLAYPGGEAQRITTDPNSYVGVSLTADASALVTRRTEGGSTIWVAPDGDAAHAKQISREASRFDGLGGLNWTPDDKLLFTSNNNGTADIWIMEPDGGQRRQLTTDPHIDTGGIATPDGRYILFSSDRTGQVDLWRMNFDGSNQTRIINSGRVSFADLSPDGKWLLYAVLETDQSRLYKVPFAGGQPTLLSDKNAYRGMVSPDGKLIAMCYSDGALYSSSQKIALLPLAGGQPLKVFELPMTVGGNARPRWSADGRALLYKDTRDGISNIWRQPLAGRRPTQVTSFTDDNLHRFAYARDGKQLAIVRFTSSGAVVLIRNFK